jgi:hypothetical protein
VRGNKCGRGNPHYRKLAANRTAFLEAVGPEQVKAVAVILLARALTGDVDAARLVLAYAVGRPQPAADPDAADADEWRMLREAPNFADVLDQSGKMPVGEAVDRVLLWREKEKPVPCFLYPLGQPGSCPDGDSGPGVPTNGPAPGTG